MKKINILGIDLCDYTLREAMRQVDIYLNNGALNTLDCLSTQMLVRAGKNPEQKEWLEFMDLLICCDVDILRAAGITARSRFKEVENNSFMKEFFRKLIREKRTVFLLSETEEQLESLENKLHLISGSLMIAGKRIFETAESDRNEDSIINDINDVAPSVILTRISYPLQEEFFFRNKERINADIWLGLWKEESIFTGSEKGFRALGKKIRTRLFQRKVHKYKNQEKTE